MRESLRTRHYSERTKRAYVDWMRRFMLFHGKRHPGADVALFTRLELDRVRGTG